MRALLAILLFACSAKQPEEAPPAACTTCASSGVVTCGKGFESDGDGGCRPVLRECAAGEIATPGECHAVGVEACGAGFTRVEDGCVPTLAKVCTGADRTVVGEAKCIALGCSEPTAGAIHVDPTFVGESDGTAARPFKDLALALAVPGRKSVFLSAGTHMFAGTVDKPVEIVGRCAATATIVSPTGSKLPAITVAAEVTLRGLAVTGDGSGVLVSSGAATLHNVWVHSSGDIGIVARGAKVTLSSSVVDSNKGGGIALDGATAVVDASELRLNSIAGIRARAGSSLTLRSSVLSDHRAETIYASKSTVLVEGSVIRRGGVDGAPEANGIYASASTVTVSKSVVDAIAGMAIGAFDGTLTIDNTVVRGTRPSKSGGAVPILVGTDPTTRKAARATIRRSLITDNTDSGLLVGATVEMSGSVVRTSAHAVVVSKQKGTTTVPNLTLRDVLVERAVRAGVSVAAGNVTLERVVVRDVKPEDAEFGIGLYVFSEHAATPATVTASELVIEDVADAGVAVFGAHLDLANTVVRRVHERTSGGYGHGIHFTPLGELVTSGSVRGCLISDVFEVGALVFRSAITLEDTTVEQVKPSSKTNDFGDGVSVTGVTSRDALWSDARATLRNCKISSVARSAVSVFNAAASVSGLLARCNALDVSIETVIEGHPSAIEDLGSNACGCATLTACRASVSNIKPIGSAL